MHSNGFDFYNSKRRIYIQEGIFNLIVVDCFNKKLLLKERDVQGIRDISCTISILCYFDYLNDVFCKDSLLLDFFP